jgi:hypothetical protein
MRLSIIGSRFKRPNSRGVLASIAMVLILGLSPGSTLRASEETVPFLPGETLVFQAKWNFLPAGEAVLKVLPVEAMNGVPSYHFVMTARTYPFIDPFYRVRDRIDAYADLKMTHSMLYKQINEGKRKKNVVLSFDLDKQTVQYSKSGKKRAPISILPGSFDPLSIFYALRFKNLKENTIIEVPVTDGKKSTMGKATVIRRETIRLERGTYDTYLVEPDLKDIGGVFRKTKDAKLSIWVTADKRRIPLRLKSKVIVGSFVAELISAEGLREGATFLRP